MAPAHGDAARSPHACTNARNHAIVVGNDVMKDLIEPGVALP